MHKSIKKEKIEKAECKMNSVNYVEMKSAKIENALKNFVVDDRYRSNIRDYYVVTKVYFCQEFDMTLFEVDSSVLKILAQSAEGSVGKLEISKLGSNKITLKSKQSIAFGVGLAKLEYSIISGGINLVPVSFSEQPTLKGPSEEIEDSIPKVYLINFKEEN